MTAARHTSGMDHLNRRDFLRDSSVAAAAASLAWPADLMAAKAAPSVGDWDHERVRHLLPTTSHNRILIKTSFQAPLSEAPTLRIGSTSVRVASSGQFHAADLKPSRP